MAGITLKPQEIALAQQLLAGFVITTEGLDALRDESEDALRALIEQKAAGLPIEEPARPDAAPPDLVAAIKRALEAAGAAAP